MIAQERLTAVVEEATERLDKVRTALKLARVNMEDISEEELAEFIDTTVGTAIDLQLEIMYRHK